MSTKVATAVMAGFVALVIVGSISAPAHAKTLAEIRSSLSQDEIHSLLSQPMMNPVGANPDGRNDGEIWSGDGEDIRDVERRTRGNLRKLEQTTRPRNVERRLRHTIKKWF